MNEEEKQMQDESIRLQCLDLAVRACATGDQLVPKAQELYEFITGPKNL